MLIRYRECELKGEIRANSIEFLDKSVIIEDKDGKKIEILKQSLITIERIEEEKGNGFK